MIDHRINPKDDKITETKQFASDQDSRSQLCEILNELYQAGSITSTGGNISVRTEDHETIWITPGQIHKGSMSPDLIVRIDRNANKVDKKSLQPSSEKYIHTEIYKTYPEINAVIHAHAPYSTTLSLCELPFLPISTESAWIEELPRIPFIMPGTMELAKAVVNAMIPKNNCTENWKWNPAILLKNHGVIVAATSLRYATNILGIIERTSNQIVSCYSLGKKPLVMPDDVVQEIRRIKFLIA